MIYIIKASYFDKAGAWHVIDFGLARRYVDEAGLVIPARADTAFRGSTTYASIAAHDGEDLGAHWYRGQSDSDTVTPVN